MVRAEVFRGRAVDNRGSCVRVGPNGHTALVDEADFDLLSLLGWTLIRGKNDLLYAWCKVTNEYMHRMILQPPVGVSVDHRNSNGLDNRRSNLRVAGQSNNVAAARLKPGLSGFRGVHWSAPGRNWRAQIKHRGNKIHIGVFSTPEQAARAYDSKALELFGEFARPNFPEES